MSDRPSALQLLAMPDAEFEAFIAASGIATRSTRMTEPTIEPGDDEEAEEGSPEPVPDGPTTKTDPYPQPEDE